MREMSNTKTKLFKITEKMTEVLVISEYDLPATYSDNPSVRLIS
jgi:hypothetical protein